MSTASGPSGNTRPCATAALCLVLVLLTLGSSPAECAVYTCSTAAGDVQFQDRPCAKSVTQSSSDRPERSAGALSRRAVPAGIHPSWFDQPPGVKRRAVCETQGCTCGGIKRRFDSGLHFAVSDALYLDGAWHRYDINVAGLVEAMRADNPPAIREQQAILEEAVCDILMSQQTLMEFADQELRRLRRAAQVAEDLGRDDESSCDGFSAAACETYMQLLSYRTLAADAGALSVPRIAPSDQ